MSDSTSQIIFKIDSKLERLFRGPSGLEREALKQDIKERGVQVPILLAEDGTIVDGHQRYDIWVRELGRYPWDLPYEIKHYNSREEMVEDAVRLNILRRHLTDGQRGCFALEKLYPTEKNKARKRIGGRPKKDEKPFEHVQRVSGEAYDRAAEKVFVTGRYLRNLAKIRDEAPEDYDKIRTGKQGAARALKNIVRRERQKKQKEGVPLPEGIYDILYADPPWRYSYDGSNRGKAEMHYQTLALKDIIELPVQNIIADDAILFLWSTNPLLPDALEVVKAWGFEYKTNFAWVKDKIGTGFYNRSQHELLLICRRGALKAPADEDRFPSVIKAPRTEHSRKPDVVYDIIETMYPNRHYLELFARPKEKREEWEYWGLEVDAIDRA